MNTTKGSGFTLDTNVGVAADTSIEGYTDTDNTRNNATDGNNSNYSKINRLKVNRNGQASGSHPTLDTSNKAFEGSEPDI